MDDEESPKLQHTTSSENPIEFDENTQVSTIDDSENTNVPTVKINLLEQLFDFLDSPRETDNELNPVLCGYFFKLFNGLFEHKKQALLEYIYEHKILDKLVAHVYSKSLSEVLKKILTFPPWPN